ncbi:MAG: GNAT family N-acetyltransferase [Actinomycetota bacterium]|nr:GNAT family N-acetyltransferase [Actinomycetota bacterium]
MAFTVRLARPDDVSSIVPWTTDTFEWGDYVPDRIMGWIESADSEVIVCEDDGGEPVAVAHALMLSDTEGWLEAARVHPDHKRSGMGSAMNSFGVEWARKHGARIVRLTTEADNVAARSQVEALGYRVTSRWVYAFFETDNHPVVGEDRRLRPAHRADVDAAWMFWSASDLAHDGRELLADGWRWRKATPGDLAEAARAKTLYQSPSGWVIADETGEEFMRSIWLATSPEEAPRLVDSLIGLAASRSLAELSVKTPNVPWMTETLARAGGNPKEVLVYSLAV